MPARAAIAGIGATEFSKNSGRSELRLAAEAVRAALDDAGLTPRDVTGLVTFTMDSNAEVAVARELGIEELTFFSQIGYGGGAACATVHQAAMAVATGAADVVVCYRALNERSGRRFGRVAVADRKHAATDPDAWFYGKPITLAQHQQSRWIVEPLRLLDCCQESDGAVALVVTSEERARDLPHRPAVIEAAAQGAGPDQFTMTSYYRDDMGSLPEMGVVARQLWRQAGRTPADIRTAILYDHFTPYVLMQLEALGFCGRGEAYIHGMNGIAEAVRQVRGTSVNQVPGDGPVLVTAGTGVPTSGLILSA